jgi:ribosome-associated translation inhibitor RaiA
VLVDLPQRPSIVIDECDADLYVAIDRVADRVKRAVRKDLDRQREHSSSP